jgi:tetratricopeptide (TPR) repeat protein
MVRTLAWLLALLAAPAPAQHALFDRAVQELNAADYPAAERDLHDFLAANPHHPGALQNLGLVYSKTGRFADAVDCYRQALQLKPNDAKLLLNLGVAHLKANQFADAFPIFQKLTADTPAARDPGVLYLLAAGYVRQNPAAARDVDALLRSLPRATAAAIQCRIDFDRGRFEEAVQHCRKSLAADPNLPGARRDLGKALAAQHDPAAASELARAVAADPNDSEAAYYYGSALLGDNDPTAAAAQFERAIRLDSSFWGSYFYLGRIRLQQARPFEAVPLLRKAADLNPSSASLFYELGRALMAAGQSADADAAMQRVRALRAEELARDTQALRQPLRKQ